MKWIEIYSNSSVYSIERQDHWNVDIPIFKCCFCYYYWYCCRCAFIIIIISVSLPLGSVRKWVHVSYFHCHYHSHFPHSIAVVFPILSIHWIESEENVLIAAQFYFNYFIVWIAKVINFFAHFCVFATLVAWVSEWATHRIANHCWSGKMKYRPMRRLNAPTLLRLPRVLQSH